MSNLQNCTFANQTCAEHICNGFNKTAQEWITSDNQTGYRCELHWSPASDLFEKSRNDFCKGSVMSCLGSNATSSTSTSSPLVGYPYGIHGLILGLVGMIWLIRR